PFFGPYWGWGWGYPYGYGYAYNTPWYLREEGYRDGISRGKSDAKHGKPDDPNSHKHYRKSESLTYRSAFLKGYSDGTRIM
ncbi:MAG TPA: hypothetical protein VEZ90_19760, partial [Blastocatellia bacterium]|nr:hypothetical protein [Blastocatellia bacterium]